MLHLIDSPILKPDSSLPEIRLEVDRLTLAKRRWRGVASNGVEFGFELPAPLRHGSVFFQDGAARYVVRQLPEAVITVSLELAPSAAAAIGWAIGNLHLDLAAEPRRLLAPDDPAVRQLLDRLKVRYEPATAVFQPGRFARGDAQTQDLGAAPKHA